MDGMIHRIVPDAGARLAQLQSGEVDIVGIEPAELTAVQGNPDINVYRSERDGYDYIALNEAKPGEPSAGQGRERQSAPAGYPRTVLGDQIALRQAMAHALDYTSIIDNVYLGQGYRHCRQRAARGQLGLTNRHPGALRLQPGPGRARCWKSAGWVTGADVWHPREGRQDAEPDVAHQRRQQDPAKTRACWCRINSTRSASTSPSRPSTSARWSTACWARPTT